MHACRQEELGHRSFAALTSTSKHRAMLQSMAASDVAVMLKEDQKLGLPQFCSTTKGLDFQRHFTTQLAGPLTGVSRPLTASRVLCWAFACGCSCHVRRLAASTLHTDSGGHAVNNYTASFEVCPALHALTSLVF